MKNNIDDKLRSEIIILIYNIIFTLYIINIT